VRRGQWPQTISDACSTPVSKHSVLFTYPQLGIQAFVAFHAPSVGTETRRGAQEGVVALE